MPLDQLQALKQKSNPNSEPINSSNSDSQKSQKKSKLPDISKLPKFVIPIFAGSLVLILIIIAGFLVTNLFLAPIYSVQIKTQLEAKSPRLISIMILLLSQKSKMELTAVQTQKSKKKKA